MDYKQKLVLRSPPFNTVNYHSFKRFWFNFNNALQISCLLQLYIERKNSKKRHSKLGAKLNLITILLEIIKPQS